MLKYFVMGLKMIIEKNTCVKCGTGLLIPAWKLCQKCRPVLKSRASLVSSNLYGSLSFHCDRNKALESDMLVYDEDMNIVGYRTRPFKIKERSI
jgi:hypothetical protein